MPPTIPAPLPCMAPSPAMYTSLVDRQTPAKTLPFRNYCSVTTSTHFLRVLSFAIFFALYKQDLVYHRMITTCGSEVLVKMTDWCKWWLVFWFMVLLVLMHLDLIELVQGCKKVDGTENHLRNFYSVILGIYTASQLKITESCMILRSRSCSEHNADRNSVVSRL